MQVLPNTDQSHGFGYMGSQTKLFSGKLYDIVSFFIQTLPRILCTGAIRHVCF